MENVRYLESGEAGFLIELKEGNIIVSHMFTNQVLKKFQAQNGDWKKLNSFINEMMFTNNKLKNLSYKKSFWGKFSQKISELFA